jgi:hypothetical protein
MKLQRIGKLLRRHYPKYDRMIGKREMKYGGLICILERFLGCPPETRYANRCKFSVGEYTHLQITYCIHPNVR